MYTSHTDILSCYTEDTLQQYVLYCMNRVKLLLYVTQHSAYEQFLKNNGTLFPFKLQKGTDAKFEHTQPVLFILSGFVLLKYTTN